MARAKRVQRESETCFEITYGVDDGYAGSKGRLHHLSIDSRNLDEDMDEDEIKRLFWDSIQDDFSQRCHPYSDQESAFVEWAKSIQQSQRSE